jgi:glycosyltransferase involved in cell wall biosynthesis
VTRFRVPPAAEGVSPGSIPSFSVVVAAYQAADVVGDALASALEQTSRPHEVIVCDDGSTDRTADVVAAFPDVTLLRKENGGPASARNAGVAAASGEFVVVLDADDVYLPDRLRLLGELGAQRPDLDVLATDAYVEVGGATVGRFSEFNPFPVDDQRTGILERCFVFAPAIRRSRLVAVGGFDEQLRTSDDWECLIRVVLSGARVGLVDAPLMHYRLREGGVSSARLASLRERVAVFEKTRRDERLSDREREVAERLLRIHRNEVELAEIEAELLDGEHPRRRLLRVVGGKGYPAATRAKAAAAIVSPGVAARRLRGRGSVRTVAPSSRTRG